MCRRIDCSSCGRPTYTGCGAHIEQVLGDVPPAERCHCREQKSEKAGTEAKGAGRSWLRSLFGK